MTTAKRWLLGGTVVFVVLVMGCGSNDEADTPAPDAAPPTTPAVPDTTAPSPTVAAPPGLADPCLLVTADDAAMLTSLPMGDGTLREQADAVSCTYNAPTDGPIGQVEIFAGQGAEQILSTDQQLGHEFVEVPGVGDEALEKDMHIFFRVDRTWYVIRVVRMADAAGYTEPLRELATEVVARL